MADITVAQINIEPRYLVALIEHDDFILFMFDKQSNVYSLPFTAHDEKQRDDYSLKTYIKSTFNVASDVSTELATRTTVNEGAETYFANCYRASIITSDLVDSDKYKWIAKNEIKYLQKNQLTKAIMEVINKSEESNKKSELSMWFIFTIILPFTPIFVRGVLLLFAANKITLPRLLESADFLYYNLFILVWLVTQSYNHEQNGQAPIWGIVGIAFIIADIIMIVLLSINNASDETLSLSFVISVILSGVAYYIKRKSLKL